MTGLATPASYRRIQLCHGFKPSGSLRGTSTGVEIYPQVPRVPKLEFSPHRRQGVRGYAAAGWKGLA